MLRTNMLTNLAVDLGLSVQAAAYLPAAIDYLAEVGGISWQQAVWQVRHNEELQVEFLFGIARCVDSEGEEVAS
jgi:hypothetical protein